MDEFYWVEIIPPLKINLHTDGGKNEKAEPRSSKDGFAEQLNHVSKHSVPNVLFSEESTFLNKSNHCWSTFHFLATENDLQCKRVTVPRHRSAADHISITHTV